MSTKEGPSNSSIKPVVYFWASSAQSQSSTTVDWRGMTYISLGALLACPEQAQVHSFEHHIVHPFIYQ